MDQDFLRGPVVKNLAASAGDMGSIPDPGGFHISKGSQACVPYLPSPCPKPMSCNKRSQ